MRGRGFEPGGQWIVGPSPLSRSAHTVSKALRELRKQGVPVGHVQLRGAGTRRVTVGSVQIEVFTTRSHGVYGTAFGPPGVSAADLGPHIEKAQSLMDGINRTIHGESCEGLGLSDPWPVVNAGDRRLHWGRGRRVEVFESDAGAIDGHGV